MKITIKQTAIGVLISLALFQATGFGWGSSIARVLSVYHLITSLGVGVLLALIWSINERSKRISRKSLFLSLLLTLIFFPLILRNEIDVQVISITIGAEYDLGTIYLAGLYSAFLKSIYLFLFFFLGISVMYFVAKLLSKRYIFINRSFQRRL